MKIILILLIISPSARAEIEEEECKTYCVKQVTSKIENECTENGPNSLNCGGQVEVNLLSDCDKKCACVRDLGESRNNSWVERFLECNNEAGNLTAHNRYKRYGLPWKNKHISSKESQALLDKWHKNENDASIPRDENNHTIIHPMPDTKAFSQSKSHSKKHSSVTFMQASFDLNKETNETNQLGNSSPIPPECYEWLYICFSKPDECKPPSAQCYPPLYPCLPPPYPCVYMPYPCFPPPLPCTPPPFPCYPPAQPCYGPPYPCYGNPQSCYEYTHECYPSPQKCFTTN